MNRLLIILLLPIVFAGSINAQVTAFSYKKSLEITSDKWEVVDIVFQAKKATAGNPFDLMFGARVIDPNGNAFDIPGFFNGNNEWVIRFSGNKAGMFTLTTYSSLQEFSGLQVSVNVSGLASNGKPGAIKIDPLAPQNFIYDDGTPYFSIIFELDWLFALDAEYQDDIPHTRQIIDDINKNGFNQVVMNLYAYESSWPKSKDIPRIYDYRKPNVFPWKGTNEAPDFSMLNTDFFKHFDRIIHHLDSQNIVAHLMIYVWNKNVNWPEMYSKADNTYFDYVIKRYQAFPNIIWDVSKEALDYGRCDIGYINERIGRIRQLDAYKRLVTVHDYEYNSIEHARVDFISIQSWRPNLYDLMLQVRTIHSDKPVVNIEHGGYEKGPYLSFEGNYTDARQCLVRAWECVFAGVYPSYYWQNAAWDIVVFDALDDKHPFDPPRYDYYKNMSAFFERYNFNELFPVEQKLTTNGRTDLENLSTGGIPLTNGTDLFLFFVPASAYQINTVLPRPERGKLIVSWFNIYTGEFTEKQEANWTGWGTFRSPWTNTDSVLVVEYE